MIKYIKNCLKLMRYSLNNVQSIFICVIFFIAGTLIELTLKQNEVSIMAGLYFFAIPCMGKSMMDNLHFCELVNSSMFNTKMKYKAEWIMETVLCIFSYGYYFLLKYVENDLWKYSKDADYLFACLSDIIFPLGFMFFAGIVVSISRIYYILGCILSIAAIFPIAYFTEKQRTEIVKYCVPRMNRAAGYFFFFMALIIIANVIVTLISYSLRKKPSDNTYLKIYTRK